MESANSGTEAEEVERKLKQREEECRATGNDFYQSVKENKDQSIRSKTLNRELTDAKSKMQQLEKTIEERNKTIELLTTENAKIIKREGDKLQSQASKYSNFLKEKIQGLEKTIEERDKTIELLTNINVEYKTEHRNLKAGVEQFEKDTNATLNQEVSDAKKQIEDRMIEINELRRLETEKDDIQRQLKETIQQRDATIEWLERENETTLQQNKEAQNKLRERAKQIKQFEKVIIEKENTIESMTGEYKDLKEGIEDRMIEINELRRLETEKDDIQRQLKETIQQRDATIEWLERENETTLQQNKEAQNKLRERAKQIKQFEKVIIEKENTIESMTGEYKDLKEGLRKMKHYNPDIIKLWDKHISTKVADEYDFLYNDAWTDASTALTDMDKLTDEKATTTLLYVLKDCHEFCEIKANAQFDALKAVLFNPVQSMECSAPRPTGNVSQPAIVHLKEVRKEISIEATEPVKAAYIKHVENSSAYGKEFVTLTRPYLEKCVEVCWSMVLHLPPLYMEFDVKVGTKVDTNLFTKRSSGDLVKALVWPPLFNGKGKGLMSKGVVEAIRTVKKR